MGRKKTTEITPLQSEALLALERFIAKNGYPPTVQELAILLGVSHASAHDRIAQLIRKGYLKREEGKARGLSIHRPLQQATEVMVPIPILGRVAAGSPIWSEENFEGELLVDSSLVRGSKCFVLYAQGQSMIEAGIDSGDLLVVRSQQLAQDGEIVVALLNGDATVKRLRIGAEKIELVPENRSMLPIPVLPEDDLRIVGKVIFWQRPISPQQGNRL